MKTSTKTRVMIIDDEKNIREGLKFCISREPDFEVAGTFPDGAEALAWLNDHEVDIILSDIRMPAMDGLTFCHLIAEKWPHILIIFLTGYAEFSYAQDALRMGVFDFLLKPCKPPAIVESLQRARTRILKEHPANEENESLLDVDNHLIRKAISYIHEHYNEDLSVHKIAGSVHLSTSYFCSLFKEETGINVNRYINQYRIRMSKKLLHQVELKGFEVANRVGYKNFRHFNEMFKKIVGTTPQEYRKTAVMSEQA